MWNDPDYTGQFSDLIERYDRDGDFGGNAVRYAIFSTLNDGPDAVGYKSALDRARRDYGLRGFTKDPLWDTDWRTADGGVIFTDFSENVVQPTVGSWLSLASWLYWFKVGFTGF